MSTSFAHPIPAVRQPAAHASVPRPNPRPSARQPPSPGALGALQTTPPPAVYRRSWELDLDFDLDVDLDRTLDVDLADLSDLSDLASLDAREPLEPAATRRPMQADDTQPISPSAWFSLDDFAAFDAPRASRHPPVSVDAAVQVAPAYFVEIFAPFRAPTLLAVRATLSAAHEVAEAIDPRTAEIVIRELILPWEPTSETHQLDTMRAWRRDGAGAWQLAAATRLRAID